MKKIVFTVLVLALVAGFACANGSPEEQRVFFDNLIRNTTGSSGASAVSQTGTSTGSEIISRDMATLERLYQYVERNYLYDIDYDAVYEAMATALFDALGDKYTYYVASDESEDYYEEVSGTYGGLGIYFTKTYLDYQDPEDDSTIYARITQVFPNTPSSRAGLKAGDYIIAIDGESVVDLEATDCARRMKGLAGTSVELTIRRGDTEFSLSIVRAIITVPTVEYDMVDSTTAYLRILEFSSNTYSAIADALTELGDKGMEKLIIDLRDNPGGDVDATLAIADLFISGSKLLSISYKDTSKNITYAANEAVLVDPSVEVAILVNGGTASSAEIFSAAMKDNGRATIFGETTYGKGVMQVISSFGVGYTSITTASFVGPSGNPIHETGVAPDVEVKEVTVLEEETEAYAALLESKVAQSFVDQNPDFTDANIERFARENLESSGLREIVLRLVVRNEYLSRLTYDDTPLFDVVYDSVCKAAYEYLQTEGTISDKVVNY